MATELTEWDIEIGNRLAGVPNKKAGMYVETKTGLLGKIYSYEELVNGKYRVYTEKGKFLCNPDTLTLKGYFD